jgi:predicted amidophosphoribosyltransferase
LLSRWKKVGGTLKPPNLSNMEIKWQNLLHTLCPRCDEKLQRDRKVLFCSACDFEITQSKISDILTDKNHPFYRHLNHSERALINHT